MVCLCVTITSNPHWNKEWNTQEYTEYHLAVSLLAAIQELWSKIVMIKYELEGHACTHTRVWLIQVCRLMMEGNNACILDVRLIVHRLKWSKNSCSVFTLSPSLTTLLPECRWRDVLTRPIEVAPDNTSLCSNCLSRSGADYTEVALLSNRTGSWTWQWQTHNQPKCKEQANNPWETFCRPSCLAWSTAAAPYHSDLLKPASL